MSGHRSRPGSTSRGSDCSSASTRGFARVPSWIALLSVQSLPEQLPCPVQLRLGGADGDPEHVRGLLMRVAVDSGEHEHVPRARGRPAMAASTSIPTPVSPTDPSTACRQARPRSRRPPRDARSCAAPGRALRSRRSGASRSRSSRATRIAAGSARPVRRPPGCSLQPFPDVPSCAGTTRKPCPSEAGRAARRTRWSPGRPTRPGDGLPPPAAPARTRFHSPPPTTCTSWLPRPDPPGHPTQALARSPRKRHPLDG